MSFSPAAFQRDFVQMSSIGATPGGGVERQAGSVADCQTRDWFRRWLSSNGFDVRLDAIGNQFGLLELTPGAPYVLVGSHLDSQPLGGKFDGAYGVLAAAFAAGRIAQEVAQGDIESPYNLCVVNWFNEEGSRFQPSMMGSAVFTGKLDLEAALQTTDLDGISVKTALDDVGHDSQYHGPDVALYGEVHIEQGRTLENSGRKVGLVDGTWAANKYTVVVHGEQSHTGATLMADRRDALLGAALTIAAVREVSDEFPAGQLHSSVSQLEVLPNSPVTIARQVTMNVDLRSPNEDVLQLATASFEARVPDVEAKASVKLVINRTHSWGVLSYPEQGVRLAQQAAEKLGLTYNRLKTVAGHDSTNMKDVVPTIMLFVPSVDGISHNEREHTRDEDALNGVDLLTEVTRSLMEGALLIEAD